MLRVFIIGTGNLGSHLIRTFDKFRNSGSPAVLLTGYSNARSGAIKGIDAPFYSDLAHLPTSDIILLCVGDSQIQEVAQKLPPSSALVAHCSGSVPLSTLEMHGCRGVFYFPQTFSKGRSPDFAALTICLEANNQVAMRRLVMLGSTLSRKRKQLKSEQRKYLHLAAVYVNNFVNHCYSKSDEIITRHKIDRELLIPLQKETLKKAIALGARDAQTGPAKRGDQSTIQSHLQLLREEDRKLYLALTTSIQDFYNEL